MAIIGVLHLTSVSIPSATSQTPATAIIKHLSDIYPTEVHYPYHLDHRLFVSTSSLLPHSTSKRTFTNIFTSSHFPQKTFIGTTSSTSGSADVGTTKSDDALSIITVPTSSSLEPFTTLLQQKLQPQWAARQFVTLDNGVSLALPIKDTLEWRLSVGDLRLAPSRISGPAAGQLRGVIIEVQYNSQHVDASVAMSRDEDKKKYDTLFRGMLKSLFKTLKLDLKLDEAKLYLIQSDMTFSSQKKVNKVDSQSEEEEKQTKAFGHEIAETYMEVLRGSRG